MFSGTTQSDSDPFGSDTELDSDEERQSTSKVESKDSLGDDKVCMLPKRLRTPSKIESVAGPSGMCRKSKDDSVSKSPSNNANITQKPKGKAKKPLKFSCVMGKISDDKEHNSSEEDVFMFPKRSKKVISNVELVKPTTSKIKYDSDDEMPLAETKKLETDSDSTPSGIDSIDVVKSPPITVENPEDTNSKVTNSGVDEKNNVSKSEKKSDSDSIKNKNSEIVEEADFSFKYYSNSTLDILNQLI